MIRYRITKRMAKALAGIQKMERALPTSRWIHRAARVRKEISVTGFEPCSGNLRFDESDCVAHRVHGVGILIGDFDVELVLEVEDDVH